ncbi:uncharacterized protein LOC131212203 [Anopheles bellator]|uniref:uncharacterized protein LOC131212203 n=1 Tax=Anopheles bellator TaxID=139047 RepID=UPI002648E3F9|nr:uncharacterized protein LOC131212203 [Anopheles bellator]
MSIGVNIRVTAHTSIGGRKYQEDFFSVAYQQTQNDQNLEYAFFGIYDGHGGAEASLYAKEHLMNTIVNQKLFWSENDADVLKSIREGYIQTHYAMWREQAKWPKTSSGLPSTAGTTASIAFIRRGKIYIGHVGDSGIVLGAQRDRDGASASGGVPHEQDSRWVATALTEDHKPESYAEKMRIMSCGGKVVAKSGVSRVVWNRPRIGHMGPVRRSTPIDEIPFLAVARSLGDLWSYNSAVDEFVVSPVPDVSVIKIDPKKFRCLIFGSDGLWNVLSPKNAVELVRNTEMENVRIALEGRNEWKNPSKLLVNEALQRWSRINMKADNTSVVIIMLDPPGPPKRDVLRSVKNTIPYVTEYHRPPADADGANEASSHAKNSNIVELVDCITRGEAIPVQSDRPSERYHNQHHHQHTTLHNYHQPAVEQYVPSTSYHDLSYTTDSFAESYNSLLDRSFENTDHSYTTMYAPTEAAKVNQGSYHRTEDTSDPSYSLTNLQTKSERLQAELDDTTAGSCSRDAYYRQRLGDVFCEGNISIIEHFHNYHHQYEETSTDLAISDEEPIQHPEVLHAHHHHPDQPLYQMETAQGYDSEEHAHYEATHSQEKHEEEHHSAAFQMERYDYRLTPTNNNGLVMPHCQLPARGESKLSHEPQHAYPAYQELSNDENQTVDTFMWQHEENKEDSSTSRVTSRGADGTMPKPRIKKKSISGQPIVTIYETRSSQRRARRSNAVPTRRKPGKSRTPRRRKVHPKCRKIHVTTSAIARSTTSKVVVRTSLMERRVLRSNDGLSSKAPAPHSSTNVAQHLRSSCRSTAVGQHRQLVMLTTYSGGVSSKFDRKHPTQDERNGRTGGDQRGPKLAARKSLPTEEGSLSERKRKATTESTETAKRMRQRMTPTNRSFRCAQ